MSRMNPRIEKKLSKRLIQILPEMYRDAWKCDETHVMCVGGGTDYWGEGQDAYTVLEDFTGINQGGYCWFGLWGFYPDGHRFERYPVPDKKKQTGKRIIEIAKIIARRKAELLGKQS